MPQHRRTNQPTNLLNPPWVVDRFRRGAYRRGCALLISHPRWGVSPSSTFSSLAGVSSRCGSDGLNGPRVPGVGWVCGGSPGAPTAGAPTHRRCAPRCAPPPAVGSVHGWGVQLRKCGRGWGASGSCPNPPGPELRLLGARCRRAVVPSHLRAVLPSRRHSPRPGPVQRLHLRPGLPTVHPPRGRPCGAHPPTWSCHQPRSAPSRPG